MSQITNSNSTAIGSRLDDLRRTLRARMPALRERYGVQWLGVFGSFVRGEQRGESDLDLLVERVEAGDRPAGAGRGDASMSSPCGLPQRIFKATMGTCSPRLRGIRRKDVFNPRLSALGILHCTPDLSNRRALCVPYCYT